ncbi:SprT-like domain-containing protein [Humidisolicoccus flavus]|uniref:SprT-like domain-containing protein n=1 Tax=Humidisolicoccus flavus TaxID=3111414 RepID=UPI00324894C7
MAELERVRHWANALIALHLDPEWTFGFDSARARAGQCDSAKKHITVSRHLAARFDDDEIHQVLLHEVAHALAGHAAGHGPQWKKIADELGYDGGRLHSSDVPKDLAPWIGKCPAGHEHHRFRRPTRQASCAKCSRTYSSRYIIVWEKRER